MENNLTSEKTEIAFDKPQDVETEKAILGLVILNNSLATTLLEKIKYGDFYSPKNAQVFEAISELSFSNQPIDYKNIVNYLEKNNKLESPDDMTYILELMENPKYYQANFESYVDMVKEKAAFRRILYFAEEARREVFNTTSNSQELIGQLSERLFNLNDENIGEGLVKISETVKETFNYMNQMANNEGDITGVTTGFKLLDKQLSGLQNSDLILLAARPSVGKTALGINIGVNAALKGKKVAVFSLEMSKRQILQRIMSILSNVELQNIISGKLTQEEWHLLYKKMVNLNNMEMYIDDTASISLTELRAKSKRKKLESGLDLIVIDYLQLMTTDAKRIENRQQEISNISRGLKALAKELSIPVLALSQLSRKSEERSNKRPMLSDLRESGAIEQDADVVMMLYREDYYEEDTEKENLIEVIIGKHRNGPTGTVELYFQKANTKFYDMDKINGN